MCHILGTVVRGYNPHLLIRNSMVLTFTHHFNPTLFWIDLQLFLQFFLWIPMKTHVKTITFQACSKPKYIHSHILNILTILKTSFNKQFSILSPMKMVITYGCISTFLARLWWTKGASPARLTCSYQDLTFAGASPELGEYVVRAGAGAGAEKTDHGNGVMGFSHIIVI